MCTTRPAHLILSCYYCIDFVVSEVVKYNNHCPQEN